MSFSGVENQWCDAWLERLHAPSGGLVYLSGYQLASASGERLVSWLERQPQVSAFIDFGPRIADIPETLMARLMALKPLVSVNRQEAAIAAEAHGFSPEVSAFGAAWLKKYAAPLIVRLDKEGACYFSPQESGLAAPFRPRSSIRSAPGTVTPAVRLPGWPPAGAWGRLRWVMPLRPGSWAIGAAIAPRTAKRYSSHTKTYRSLRQ
jgi:sugar/nucleoside kinase (ribokinase family)